MSDEQAADTVEVNIWENEDGEACWLTRCERPHMPDSDWQGEISFDRMAEWDMAQALAKEIIAEAVDGTGRNVEGEWVEACKQWDGVTIPAETRWVVVLDASEDIENVWPARPVDLGEPYTTRATAEAALADLFGPEGDQSIRLVVAYSNAGHFADVTRDRVSIQERHRREMVTSCTCGHSREEHS
jgi:hypothetical protein